MSENIIRKAPLAVRRTLGDFIGEKVNEGMCGDRKRNYTDYDERRVYGVFAHKSRRGNYVIDVELTHEGAKPNGYGDGVKSYGYSPEWRLVISPSGRIIAESYNELFHWDDGYGF